MSVRSFVPSPKGLPENPSLEFLRKQAKLLLQDLRRLRPGAKLSEAQHQVAHAYGFASWPKLKVHVEGREAEPLGPALRALREGRCVILFDDAGHENEGDFVLAAEKASPDAINFMVRKGGGTLCLALPPAQIDRLGLRPINGNRTSMSEPAFTAGIDAATGITTGVSSADRAKTILAAVQSEANPQSIRTPGHIFPLRAEAGGLASRRGHTEGTLELMHRAGLKPAAAIIEILNADGTMARLADAVSLAAEHKVPIVKMSELLG